VPPTLSLTRGSTTLALTDANGITVTPGVQGFDTPPVVLSESNPADFDGSIVTNVRYAPRDVFIPIGVTAETEFDQRTTTRSLASLLNPQLGPVTLTVTHPPKVAGNQLSANATGGVAIAFDAGSGDTLTTVSSPTRTGSQALQITGSNPLQATLKSAERVTVVPAATYTASAYVRASSTGSACTINILFYDSGGLLIGIATSASVTSVSNAWREVTVSIDAPAAAVKVGLRVSSGTTSIWDDFSIVEGSSFRDIAGYASAPLGETITAGEATTWRRLGITLRCEDPFFTSKNETTSSITSNSSTAYNPGDADAWPVWRLVIEPGFALTIVNTSISGSPTFACSDAFAGVILNTDPRSLSALQENTTNSAWSAISGALFPFAPGANLITGTNFGGLSFATATFKPRWLTAW
jgi:hypothetical protein